MTLKEWLKKEKLSVIDFARQNNLGANNLYMKLRGEGLMRVDTAKKIEKATGGEVTAQELLLGSDR